MSKTKDAVIDRLNKEKEAYYDAKRKQIVGKVKQSKVRSKESWLNLLIYGK